MKSNNSNLSFVSLLLCCILIFYSGCQKDEEPEPQSFNVQYCYRITNANGISPDFANFRFTHRVPEGYVLLNKIILDESSYREFKYDSMDRLILSIRQAPMFRDTTFYYYDGDSQKVLVSKENETKSYYEYDSEGFLYRKISYSVKNGDTIRRSIRSYYYNNSTGQPCKLVIDWEEVENFGTIQYHVSYDGKNHPFKNSTIQFGYYTYSLFLYPIHLKENILWEVCIYDGDTLYDLNRNFRYDNKNYLIEDLTVHDRDFHYNRFYKQ